MPRTQGPRLTYCATNKINGKFYIGQTYDFEKRKRDHIREALAGGIGAFHRAIRKYGAENFHWQVLHRDIDPLDINETERALIVLNKSLISQNGYNVSPGGASTRGYRHTRKTRRKISAAKKGRSLPPLTAEHKRKIGDAHLKLPNAVRIKRAESVKKYWTEHPEEAVARGAKIKGRRKSLEHKKRLSDSLRAFNERKKNV